MAEYQDVLEAEKKGALVPRQGSSQHVHIGNGSDPGMQISTHPKPSLFTRFDTLRVLLSPQDEKAQWSPFQQWRSEFRDSNFLKE